MKHREHILWASVGLLAFSAYLSSEGTRGGVVVTLVVIAVLLIISSFGTQE